MSVQTHQQTANFISAHLRAITGVPFYNLSKLTFKKFASDEVDLSPVNIDNLQMGYAFEELIRIGAEQSKLSPCWQRLPVVRRV